ncbi:hypothetical protein [Sphingomonas sp.]|uniref:hypothetical protein n=1 Tax=Sphingomonas sp. TaxID=28214 RepID=UPI001ED1DE48|nr:hypothetical protein [Sphingomonas sp.]MBX3595557.1 hypothetical protein [Sphingomonas sp.]
MIAFEPTVQEPKLLRSAVLWAKRNKDHIPSISSLAPTRGWKDLTALGRSWQEAGLGALIEASEDGRRTVYFSLNDNALTSVDAEFRRSLIGRLQAVPRAEWISLSSMLVSVGALVVAILAYLKA